MYEKNNVIILYDLLQFWKILIYSIHKIIHLVISSKITKIFFLFMVIIL